MTLYPTLSEDMIMEEVAMLGVKKDAIDALNTPQEVVDYVRGKLIAQGRQAVAPNGTCKYRVFEDVMDKTSPVLGCGIGHLCPDEEYDGPAMDRRMAGQNSSIGVLALIDDTGVPLPTLRALIARLEPQLKALFPFVRGSIALLFFRKLQSAHDDLSAVKPEHWAEEVENSFRLPRLLRQMEGNNYDED